VGVDRIERDDGQVLVLMKLPLAVNTETRGKVVV
jgi:hypothetical protein